MSQSLTPPLSYLITSGATDPATTPASREFARLVALVESAADAGISLVQLREKLLRPRVLYELAARAADITRGSATRLIVNDRADIARAAGADGVQLTTRSLPASVVRRTFDPEFLIGVSTHSLAEAQAARDEGANFALLGPVFDTPSKRAYGPPVGLDALRAAARALAPVPLVAIGGITHANMADTLAAGAHGIAAIRLFADPRMLADHVQTLRAAWAEVERGAR
ncbi:MAG: thiamine phosphate synthase [Pyrinomonadaceae bacterium]